MANQEHLDILKQGVEVWNKWRDQHPEIEPDLNNTNFCDPIFYDSDNEENGGIGVNFGGINFSNTYLHDVLLCGANLARANLEGADLCGADLSHADFTKADLTGAKLINVDLSQATMKWADLQGANLIEANLMFTRLFGANLSHACLENAHLTGASAGGVDFMMADLTGANFGGATIAGSKLVRANLTNAKLVNCSVYGVSVWDAQLKGTVQSNLYINAPDQPKITLDNIEVAQFIHLLLNNKKLRDVIDTIISKVVLILGRFTDERKPVLDALRDELRKHNYSPVIFDFEPSAKRDLTETISILAHLSRFVIADLTDAKSLPQELERIVPHLPSVPVQPILQVGTTEYAMFEHYERYPWVLPIYRYQDISSLLVSIKEHIIKPVEQKEYEKDKKKALEEEIRKLREEIEKLRGGK